ncbi:hypothetical protein KY290_023327 [Solanum tuberosum]|uniref:AD domain-containing protein n=1 Tax=Solanum tuberosum TaxID=4113 RepID=A0ABQ7V8M1_SOLTU|nr:hypothetical protein KY289_022379 [Solanum tuberosum]KAH0695068.1 hypothetical protein KY285_022165 [Solanum tuberosum]KAH0759834.1 hypothetical protein KY290_023327 [Solanum tuberosum]
MLIGLGRFPCRVPDLRRRRSMDGSKKTLLESMELDESIVGLNCSVPAAPMEAFNNEEFAIGCALSIKTTLGPKRDIRLLKANYIKEFSFLGQNQDPLDTSKCYLDLSSLQAREDSALRQAEIDAERFGIGVTAEAQNIFDALSKTLPVRWDKTVIVVMNEVRVSSPYLPESVVGGTPAANERVRKVLELERKRLQSRNTGQ